LRGRKLAAGAGNEDAGIQEWQRNMRVRAQAVHRFETLAYDLNDCDRSRQEALLPVVGRETLARLEVLASQMTGPNPTGRRTST
jgi:hypothetical protein